MDDTTLTEQQIVMCWFFTDTIKGCQAALETLRDLEKEALTVEDADLYHDAVDLLFAKGNMMRLIENQISFVGDMK